MKKEDRLLPCQPAIRRKPGYIGVRMDLRPVLELACREYFTGASSSYHFEHAEVGDRCCVHQCGALTSRIAVLFEASVDYRISISTIRSILHDWEARGEVLATHAPGYCSRWWPVGLAAKLCAEVDAHG